MGTPIARMTLAVQILLYRDDSYLADFFASLAAQTDQNWMLCVRDQNPTPENPQARRTHLGGFPQTLHWETGENLGFAGGHQQLFTRHDAALVLLLNTDMVLDPGYLAAVRAVMEADPSVHAAAGVIMRLERRAGSAQPTARIDSAGLQEEWFGRVRDLTVAPQTVMPVFGVSGCAPLLRRQSVERVSPDGTLFFPLYHSYKEDVDLAYRLAHLPGSIVVVPSARAAHVRSVRSGWARLGASAYQDIHSYRNHLWNLLQHLSARDFLRRAWAILPYECLKSVFLFLRRPRGLWYAWASTWMHRHALVARRRFFQSL